jgi:hypothetical protein
MKQYVLKSITSSIILVGHFLIISLILFMYFRGGFTHSEMTSALAVFLPITSVYASAIVKDIVATRDVTEHTARKYSVSFGMISCSLTFMFIMYFIIIIVLKSYNVGIADFDQFKSLLILGETIFAAYVGQIVHAMFSAAPAEVAQSPPESIGSEDVK